MRAPFFLSPAVGLTQKEGARRQRAMIVNNCPAVPTAQPRRVAGEAARNFDKSVVMLTKTRIVRIFNWCMLAHSNNLGRVMAYPGQTEGGTRQGDVGAVCRWQQ